MKLFGSSRLPEQRSGNGIGGMERKRSPCFARNDITYLMNYEFISIHLSRFKCHVLREKVRYTDRSIVGVIGEQGPS